MVVARRCAFGGIGLDITTLIVGLGSLEQGVQDLIKMHGILLAIILWVQWITRNKLVFEHRVVPLSSQMMQVWSLFKDINNAYGIPLDNMGAGRAPLDVSWQRPNPGGVVLNVDGSTLSNPGKTGFGGLVRNEDGEFLMGFLWECGHNSHWACRDSSRVAWPEIVQEYGIYLGQMLL